MNIYDVFKNGGITVNNPDWDKKHPDREPRTVIAPANEKNSGSIYSDAANVLVTDGHAFLNPNAYERAKQLKEYGLTLNTDDDRAIELQLADAQSTFSKAWHGLTQTVVNEIGLGIPRGFSDLTDFVIGGVIRGITGEENDYTNPVSEKLKEWQDAFEKYQPIYRDKELNIANGGLLDAGWWFANMPSVMSSITLLMPSTATAKTVSAIGRFTGINKGLGNTRRFLTQIDKVDKALESGKDLNSLQRAAQFINNENTVQIVNTGFELGVNSFMSRTLENYQEANQVYQDNLPYMYNGDPDNGIKGIKDMSEQEYADFVNSRSEFLQGVDTNNRSAVAKRLAKVAADRTFALDFANAAFDFYQLYALRNITRFMNQPLSAAIRRKQLNSIKYAKNIMNGENIEDILKNRSNFTKVKEKLGDYLYGSKLAITAEASEGVEEAINYIAQEEGMRYGQILLNNGAAKDPWDKRLVQYMKNPQLYDSAFWGVLGGVVFNYGGSKLAQAENAYKIKKAEYKYKPDDTTKESIQKTPWSEAFELPEVQRRLSQIQATNTSLVALKQQLELIQSGVNPFEKNEDGTNVLFTTEEEKAIARDKAYANFENNALRNSMFIGNWDLTKAFLESDEVKDALVSTGLISQEEANRRQQEIQQKASRMEELYNHNLRAIGNAMRGKDPKTGADYSSLPIEYMQIIAAENMQYQLEADQNDRNINSYTGLLNSEQKRLEKELKDLGVDYQDVIRLFTIAQQLGLIKAELAAARKTLKDGRSKDDIDSTTISGQSAIRELELREKVLTNMINTVGANSLGTNPGARLLVALRAAASVEKNNKGQYISNTKSQRYKDLDQAIVNAYTAASESDNESAWSNAKDILSTISPEFNSYTKEQIRETFDDADTFNNMLNKAFGVSKDLNIEDRIKTLAMFSEPLLNAYTDIALNEINKEIALSHIAKDKNSIRTLAHIKHNEMQAMRSLALETALYSLKALAKKYNNELKDSDLLAYGTIDENKRNQLKEILSEEDMRTYDDLMKIMGLHIQSSNKNINIANSLLPEMVKDAIYQSSLDDFSEVGDKLNTEENNKQEEKSSASQNSITDTKNTQTDNTSQTASQSDTAQNKQEKIEFYHTSNGRKLERPVALIHVNANGAPIRLTRYKNNYGDEAYSDAFLIPVEGLDNTYELALKEELENDSKTGEEEIFNNANFFNIKTPFIDGGQIIQNPVVTVDDDGNIVSSKPGIIDNPNSQESQEILENKKEESDQASSTGYVKPDNTEEIDPASFDVETDNNPTDDAISNEPYDVDNLISDLGQKMIIYSGKKAKAREALDMNQLYNELREEYKDKVSDEDFNEAFKRNEKVTKKVYDRHSDSEARNIIDFIDASNLTDTEVGGTNVQQAAKELNDTFKKILEKYIVNSVAESYNGKQVISLENLLRYANEVMQDETFGQLLYDKFLEQLRDTDKYILVEGRKPRKSEIIDRATMTSEDRFNNSNSSNGRTINLASIFNLSKKDKQKVYDALDKLNPGNEISYTVDGYKINMSVNGVKIGTLFMPKVTDNYFNGIMKGWKVDLPKNPNDGTTSKLEQLFIRIMVNPNKEEAINPIIDALIKGIYTKKTIFDKDTEKRISNPEYAKIGEEILDAIENAGINISEYTDLSKYERKDLVDALLNIYRGVKSVSEQFLGKQGLSAEDYHKAINNRRTASIKNWFNRLRDSYDAANRLANNPSLKIQVDTINEGGLIITSPDEALPVNQEGVIGSNHKGQLQLAVADIETRGKIHITNVVTPMSGSFSGGSTFVAIPKKNGIFEFVHAFPQTIGAINSNKDINNIKDDVLNEFSKLLNEWGSNVFKSTDDIAAFINKLCGRVGGNNPLFRGLKVEPLTNDFEGIQISYFEHGKKKYIKLFDSNKGNKVSYIKFGNDKAFSIQTEENRKKAINKVKDIVINALTYNIEFDYVKGSSNLQGLAKINTKGEFVISINGEKEYTFKSYKDFIIDNGLVAVTTKSEDGKTNFYRPGSSDNQYNKTRITYRIVSKNETSPVKENAESTLPTQHTTSISKGEEIKSILDKNENPNTIGETIINKILNDTQLKVLKNSALLKAISLGNIIFVEKGIGGVAAHFGKDKILNGVKIPKGIIGVTQKWLDLLNSEDVERHEEAVRHLIHESIHRKIDTLSKQEQKVLFDSIREIFKEFVEANERDGVRNDFKVYEYNSDNKSIRKYYTNGELNLKGIEEFLVESITRPHLINRLNAIAADGGKVTNRKVGNIKSKNLFQKILAVVSKLFGLNINKGSLLEKEYKLFSRLGETNNTKEVVEQQQTETKETEQVVETKEEPKVAEPKSVENITIEYAMQQEIDDDMIDESFSTDKEVASLSQVRDTIIPENRRTFESLVSKGAIQINC